MTLLIAMSWIISGVLAYGLVKNYWRQFFKTLTHIGYRSSSEEICVISGIMGPIGLLLGFVMTLLDGYKLGFCWRMLKELCEPRHPE